MTRSRSLELLGRLLVLTMLLATPGCATTGSGAVTSNDARRVACQSFEPIWWSAADSVQTVAQIKEHNASGKALCGWSGSK